jgi:hypothetical protein
MDTSRIRTADAELDAARAIAQLERANTRLLECCSFDVAEMEPALAERDEAVRAITTADLAGLPEPLTQRLLRAFEDGRRIRQKLAAFYRSSDAELRRLERFQAGDARPSEPPGISAVG